MSKLEPVIFPNRDGLKLIGILHQPEPERRKSTAIILLSPGVKMRVAPHGMYNKMADHYVEMGFPVLRFDFYGLGDAEGEIELQQLSNIYNTIQLGRYVNDTLASMDWMQEQYGISKFIVGGLCGGAITGMLAAQQDMRVTALLALGIPVALDVGEENWHKHLSQGQLSQLRSGYIKNLFKPKSWLRLLTLQSDFRVIWKSVWQLLKSKFSSLSSKKPVPEAEAVASEDNSDDDNTNPKFAPAFLHMLETSRPMLHVFSGTDRLAWEFDEKFAHKYQPQLEQYSSLLEIHTIDKANHILGHPEWFNQMLDISGQWLKRFN